MKLQYIFASGSLVESIDILCDNGGQLSGGFQLGKLQMCFIWLRIKEHHFLFIKIIKFFRMLHEKAVAYNLLR